MKTTRDMNCLKYNGIKMYNELPNNIKDCENMILTEYCKNN